MERGRSGTTALSVMMFLQYAVWGVWLPYLANYLGSGWIVANEQLAPAQTFDLGHDPFVPGESGLIFIKDKSSFEKAIAATTKKIDDAETSEQDRATARADRDQLHSQIENAPEKVDLAVVKEQLTSAGYKRVGGGLWFSGAAIGWILGLAGSIGAIFAPFLAGQIADRFINAEKWLGILLITGGALKYLTFYAHSYESFLAMSILYSIAYMPTLAITNSIAFAHLKDPQKQFGPVRTWGTIGWIIASNAFPLIWLQTNLHPTSLPPFLAGDPKPDQAGLIADALRVSGVMAIGYGIWAMLFLPKTPPTRSSEHPFAFLKALEYFKHRGLLIMTIAALPISMIHQVYFIRTGPFIEAAGYKSVYIGPIMSIGQIAEIIMLAILGLFLKRLGFKLVLALGCVAYFVRFALFALADGGTKELILLSCVLHGLCYGFFFAGAYIYLERIVPKDARHSAQTLFGVVILGAGPVLAGFYNAWLGSIGKENTTGVQDWALIWWVQGFIGLACAVLVLAAFKQGVFRDESTEEIASVPADAAEEIP